MAELTDTRYGALAAAIRKGGDEAARAMDELVRTERAHLARTLWQNYPQLRGDVEDIVAETFEKVWVGAQRCQCFEESGTYAGFRSLVQRQASFLALSRLRRESERKAKAEVVSVEALQDSTSEAGRPFDLVDPRDFEETLLAELDARETIRRVLAARGALNERQRQIAALLLTLPESEVNEAICRALHVSEGTAREAKRAVRQRLRQLIFT